MWPLAPQENVRKGKEKLIPRRRKNIRNERRERRNERHKGQKGADKHIKKITKNQAEKRKELQKEKDTRME